LTRLWRVSVEGERELLSGDFEANMAEVVDGSEAALGDLVDVEGKLGLDVLVLAFSIVNVRAVFGGELGEFNGNGEVGGLGVPNGVADVVAEGADGERKLIRVAGVAEQIDDEIACADVVGEVGEEPVAEGIVADVLDDAATVGISAGVLDLSRGEGGISAEQQRDDGRIPCEIDELLVRQQGVTLSVPRRREEEDAKKQSNKLVPQGHRFLQKIAARPSSRLYSSLLLDAAKADDGIVNRR